MAVLAELPVLLYDADCGFCTRSVQVGERLGCRYEATPFQTWPHLAEHGITPEAAAGELHLVVGEQVLTGHRAVAAALRTSRHRSVALAGRVLASRALTPVAAPAYRWVARHRHQLPGGTAACALEESK